MPVANPKKQPFDREKFRELILYFAQQCAEDSAFGATKLNKLLFMTDFFAYARHGAAVTGATYFKLPHGPAPKQMKPMTAQMQRKDIAFEKRDRFGKTQVRVVALRNPNLSGFDPEEIAIANEAIRSLWHANASEVSDWTHTFRGWRIAGEQEEIPYESIFLGDDALPGDLLAHAKEVARAHSAWRSASAS